MKAYYFDSYGAPEEVLSLKEVPQPNPNGDEVLIRIKAAAINDYDWCAVSGKPRSYRLLFGLFKPKKKIQIPGMEMSGEVVKVGDEVKHLKPGNLVYGDTSEYGFGSLAEYMCISEKALALKPDHMSFVEAASISHAGNLAVQALQGIGQIQMNQSVLINGGGGGVGALGLQFAKLFQATVTGVDSGNKLELMRKLGFDRVIDYKREDFTKANEKYDLILDCKTSRSPFSFLKVLSPNGKYISIGGSSAKLLQLALFRPLISMFSSKTVRMLMLDPNKDLSILEKHFKSGKIRNVIDGPYEFDQVPWAIDRFGKAHHCGKVVVSVG